MTDMECLSLLELVDVRSGAEDPEARDHLSRCPRCQALLAGLPENLEIPNVPGQRVAMPARAIPPIPERIQTGQLWRAMPVGWNELAEVVAVLGRSPEADDRYLVVPVVTEPEMATERDLVLDAALLGYAFFLDLANLGTLLRGQLAEYLGSLNPDQSKALVSLYRFTLGAATAPEGLLTGVPVVSEQDPRLLAADARGERLRALWRAVDEQVSDEIDDELPSQTGPGLADVIDLRLLRPASDWGRSGLLEASRVDGARLDAFLQDRLDLTDKRDIEDLAKVLSLLGVAWDEAEPAVAVTLLRSPGGKREAIGPAMRAAARSQPGASAQDTTDQLYGTSTRVDASAEARRGEIAAYMAELQRILDDLK